MAGNFGWRVRVCFLGIRIRIAIEALSVRDGDQRGGECGRDRIPRSDHEAIQESTRDVE